MSSKAARSKGEKTDGLPPDAVVIKELLSSMGVTDYEPRVVHQLLNAMYRHVADILQDAEAYKQRLGTTSSEIGMEDLLLAIQSRESYTFLQPPAQSVVAEIAAEQNKKPLPDLSNKPGFQIPVNSLTGPSYQLTVPSDTSLPAEGLYGAEPENGSSLRGGGNKKPKPIQISLNEQTPVDVEWMDTS